MHENDFLNKIHSYNLINQVHTIANECFENIIQLDSSLCSGKAGLTILHGYLSKLYPEKYEGNTIKLVKELVHSLQLQTESLSLSQGVAGISFSINHIQKLCDLKILENNILNKIDDYLYDAIEEEFRKKNWDILHGYLGIGLYFIEREPSSNRTKILNKIVEELYQCRINYLGYYLWVTPGYKNVSKDNINFGTAHGIPGIISFLSIVARNGIAQTKCKEMIENCLDYFISFKDVSKLNSIYPSTIDLLDGYMRSNSRLGWCYGDLSICNAFLHASKTFGRPDWFNRGISIALNSVSRKFVDSGIVDCSFCHGIAGVIHQYQRYYKLTNNIKFRLAIIELIEISQSKFYKKGFGIGGYNYSIIDEKSNKRKLVPTFGLLEGSAGIALVYLSIIYDLEPNWDTVFLTNI
jgi:lantibiotic modifying enzyme